MRKQKILSLALSMVLGVSLCGANIAGTSEKISGETENEKLKIAEKKVSVFDEIKKTDISKDELNSIADLALTDGKKTAEKVNAYVDDTDYEAALNYALTSYYKTEKFDEMDEFKSELDERANEIVKGYEDAAEERAEGVYNGYEPGEVLALFDEDTSKEEIEAACEAGYGEVANMFENFDGTYTAKINISLGQTVEAAAKFYDKFSKTTAADKNYIAEPVGKPAGKVVYDPYASNQYYLDTIEAVEAWDYVHSHNHSRVLVAVIDTGIDLHNTDFSSRISRASADVTGDTIVPLENMPSPYRSDHGSLVASTICAETNDMGIAGVASAYDNSVVNVAMIQAGTYYEEFNGVRFSNENLIKALNYVTNIGAKVVNASYAGTGSSSVTEQVYQSLEDRGIIIVAGAGNDNSNAPYYPDRKSTRYSSHERTHGFRGNP